MSTDNNRRILLIDDNQDIHRDFGKILAGGAAEALAEESIRDVEDALFGDDDDLAEPRSGAAAPGSTSVDFELESALQGREGLKKLERAVAAERPFALAFVDMRMPPGWDGVETIQHLWEADPDLQVVVCTAFADYTWTTMVAELGRTDRLLILKKPFDAIEVCQLATALTMKWDVTRRERQRMEEVIRAEGEARAYAASLETVNRALEQSKLSAEAAARSRSRFLAEMTGAILGPMGELFDVAERVHGGEPTSDEWHNMVERLCRDGRELSASLEDVRELSAMEAGTLDVARVACSPRAIAEEVANELRVRADGSEHEITVEGTSAAPESIESDPERIRRVLRHLVLNAVTYAGDGPVRITVDSGPAGEVHFAVVDNGSGVSNEQRTRLFEAFCHADASDQDPEDGAGLGLHVSKRLAHALGGDLKLSSGAHGTSLVFSLAPASAVRV